MNDFVVGMFLYEQEKLSKKHTRVGHDIVGRTQEDEGGEAHHWQGGPERHCQRRRCFETFFFKPNREQRHSNDEMHEVSTSSCSFTERDEEKHSPMASWH